MFHRRFILSWIALVSLLLPGLGKRAEADYGLESNRPLSDPRQATIDERPVGTWRTIIDGKQYFLHAGTGNIVGQSNWMELVLVHPGEKPSFYLHHKIGFTSTIGGQSFFSVTNMSVLISQLRGSKTEELTSSVERYDIFKYDVTEDYLDVWAADQKLVREAIEAGKIKGSGQTIDDTTENLIRFIESSADKLWGKKVRYTRVK
ncbi:MAG: hypothetical protein ACYTG0_07700 [Planctomycetota bacterium]|jgi:hypothetical protein